MTRPSSAPSSAPVPPPAYLPAAAHSYLGRSADSLAEAGEVQEVPRRYALAHVAALQATAALLAVRASPVATTPRGRRQRNAWVLLAQVAPEFAEWAEFFAAGAAKRAAAEAGSTRAVTEREADDLLRDATRFLRLVETSLGLMPTMPMPTLLAASATAAAASAPTALPAVRGRASA